MLSIYSWFIDTRLALYCQFHFVAAAGRFCLFMDSVSWTSSVVVVLIRSDLKQQRYLGTRTKVPCALYPVGLDQSLVDVPAKLGFSKVERGRQREQLSALLVPPVVPARFVRARFASHLPLLVARESGSAVLAGHAVTSKIANRIFSTCRTRCQDSLSVSLPFYWVCVCVCVSCFDFKGNKRADMTPTNWDLISWPRQCKL